ncbi:MAG: CDP-6-deoxy-delta-3,4-glucoseen reductase [Wenzhouxiangellaceae bacterium]|nr:CDP-6-deoxy-delta-3,4-glucoseen reductase [Wenzhouxiangellaceae bacterium]
MIDQQDHLIRIVGSGKTFRARSSEALLSAALRHGIILPYSCRNGTCASCKCKLVDGSVTYPFNPPAALEPGDIADGAMLACQAVATSDLDIEATEIEQIADIPVRVLPARVEQIDELTPDVRRLRLKLPRGKRLQFLAGQYMDILLPGGKRRAFSIASSPSQQDFLELHVKYVDGGGFTGHVFDGMQAGEILRLEGPLGTFFVRLNSARPILMMGGGTGFAPLKAMIEDLIHADDQRPITLYWGVRTEKDFYATSLIAGFEQQHPNFHFVPVLSEPGPEWQGRTGFVHQALLADHADIQAFEIYMSGPPVMVHSARKSFLEAGISESHLHYDSFDFAPDVPPADPV